MAHSFLSRLRRSARLRWNIQHIHGPGKPLPGEGPTVVCLVRDGEPWLSSFLAHYRRLGVRHMVFLDNASVDRTVDLASREPDCTVLRTTLPYRGYNNIMKEYLLRRFGGGRWCLLADIDELFDYPHSDRVDLPALVRYLGAGGYTAMVAHLLDMFEDAPIDGAAPLAAPFHVRERYRWYDIAHVSEVPYEEHCPGNILPPGGGVRWLTGGIRSLVFGNRTPLGKHPLVFVDRRLAYVDPHTVAGARVADVTGVLLHFKFVNGFKQQVERAVREEQYSRRSAKYKSYREKLVADPALALRQPTSRILGSADELLDAGFVSASPRYREFASRAAERATGATGSRVETLVSR